LEEVCRVLGDNEEILTDVGHYRLLLLVAPRGSPGRSCVVVRERVALPALLDVLHHNLLAKSSAPDTVPASVGVARHDVVFFNLA
jgi:hypothetical protein